MFELVFNLEIIILDLIIVFLHIIVKGGSMPKVQQLPSFNALLGRLVLCNLFLSFFF